MTLRIRRRRCQHCRQSGDGAHQCRYLGLVRDHAAAVDRLAARIGSDYPFLRYSDYLLEVHGRRPTELAWMPGSRVPCAKPPSHALSAMQGVRVPLISGTGLTSGTRYPTESAFSHSAMAPASSCCDFQAFSNTHAPVAQLRATYSAGLDAGEFEGLIVSTRPDCVDEPRADLLAEFAAFTEVWVELGLQSANDRTLRRNQKRPQRRGVQQGSPPVAESRVEGSRAPDPRAPRRNTRRYDCDE
jgi:hypothetical protein